MKSFSYCGINILSGSLRNIPRNWPNSLRQSFKVQVKGLVSFFILF